MSDLQLTAEQKQAIFSSGHNILVSASAGSGKTFVMANRIIEKIKSGVDIESLFISTFTKKAAGELRQRIEKDLKEAIQSSSNLEERQKLGFALQRLSNADIGTMDSFTQKLLKTHFNLVDVDPNFNILADKTERDLIQEDIFENLVEAYLSEDENIPSAFQISKKEFEKMIKNFSTGRNIKGFKDVVYSIYSFSLSTENPIKWLENQFLEGYSKYKKFSDLPSEFTGQLHEELSKFYEQLDNLLQENALTAKTLEKAQIVYDNKTFLLEALINKDFSQFTDLFNSLDWFRWTIKDEAFKKRFNETIGTKASPGLARQFNEQVKHSPIIEEYQPQAVELIKNLQIFSLYFYKVYLDRKRQENTFDYADIAHFAIEILENNPQVADFYRAKYNEIMIDEYQDTSHVQEKMLQLLSKNGDGTDNIFMVGDIKQSIYGFRQADPSLFLKKYQDYQKEDNPHELIRLKENFRSRPEIIQFTNQVFTHLMDTSVGEMTYGKEEELVQGNIKDYPQEPEQDFLPELLLYQSESNGNTDDENLEKVSDGEIRATAKQIQQLIKNGIQPKNIAILVRSKTNNNKIEDILTSYDIPLVLDEGRVEFLKSIEVQVMLDVLRAIDNPLYDIPLVATLRSPLFRFNEDELTRLSLQGDKKDNFWTKLNNALAGNGLKSDLIDDQLEDKINKFRHTFTEWRKLVNQMPIHELLWKIYTDSYYFDYVGALQNGQMRQANLQALTSRASNYEKSGYKGLFKFIKMIDKFMEQKNDLASVHIKLPQNAVRVMTFHKSKGLEFDYVFLMNFQSKFNQKDLQKSIIINRDNGVGIQYIADFKHQVDTIFPYALVKMDTLPYTVNRELVFVSGLSEEMRVLYVAFTRAKKKLYMVGKIKENERDKYADIELENNILPDKYRKTAQGFQHWLLALEATKKLSMQLTLVKKGDLQSVNQEFTSHPNFQKLAEESVKYDGIMDKVDDIKEAQRIMNYEYEHSLATELPSIQTPSQLKKRSYEKIIENSMPIHQNQNKENRFEFLNLENKKLTATEIGTAWHSFMQEIDLQTIDREHLQATLEQMKFSDELKNQIDIDKILTLFDTELGQFLEKYQDKLIREAPFSMLKTDEKSQEHYLVRGICDGFVKLGDKIVLFDYKTDRFTTHSEIEQIRKRYDFQLDLYAEALHKAYGIEKIEKYLILLGGSDKVEVVQL